MSDAELRELALNLKHQGDSILSALDTPNMNASSLAELALIGLGELAEGMGVFRHLTKGQGFATARKFGHEPRS